MVSLLALWLPIVLAAVAVFIASSLVHMVLQYHNNDYRRFPDEEAARRAVGALGLAPGNYAMPHCAKTKEMSSPEFVARYKEGPVAFMTVLRSGNLSMGPALAQWFVFLLVVGVFTAYVTRLSQPAGAAYLPVHRIAGTAAFMAYGLGMVPQSIWFHRDWKATGKSLFDALVYGLLTGGVFGWLWP